MAQYNDNKEIEKRKPDNRWWEFYFVRYFVGTALGAIVVLFLVTANSPVSDCQGELAVILKTLKPEKFESGYIAVLATVGLAFCYIASAPILVLHAVRGSLLKVRNTTSCKLVVFFSVIVLVVAGIQSYKLWLALSHEGNSWVPQDFYLGAISLLFVSIIFVGQMFLLWFAIFGREQHAFEYYDHLVQRRASASAAGNEYIESYRHLREHGNAFFIVFLELLLGTGLFYFPFPWIVILILWILPAVGVWLFGTLLESRNF